MNTEEIRRIYNEEIAPKLSTEAKELFEFIFAKLIGSENRVDELVERCGELEQRVATLKSMNSDITDLFFKVLERS